MRWLWGGGTIKAEKYGRKIKNIRTCDTFREWDYRITEQYFGHKPPPLEHRIAGGDVHVCGMPNLHWGTDLKTCHTYFCMPPSEAPTATSAYRCPDARTHTTATLSEAPIAISWHMGVRTGAGHRCRTVNVRTRMEFRTACSVSNHISLQILCIDWMA